jgi:hypothetical protein
MNATLTVLLFPDESCEGAMETAEPTRVEVEVGSSVATLKKAVQQHHLKGMEITIVVRSMHSTKELNDEYLLTDPEAMMGLSIVRKGGARYGPGSRVLLQGLDKRVELNGREAIVIEWRQEQGRFSCLLVDEEDEPPVMVREDHLRALTMASVMASTMASPSRKKKGKKGKKSKKGKNSEWICAACTFNNKAANATCEVCGGDKEPPDQASTNGASNAHPPSKREKREREAQREREQEEQRKQQEDAEWAEAEKMQAMEEEKRREAKEAAEERARVARIAAEERAKRQSVQRAEEEAKDKKLQEMEEEERRKQELEATRRAEQQKVRELELEQQRVEDDKRCEETVRRLRHKLDERAFGVGSRVRLFDTRSLMKQDAKEGQEGPQEGGSLVHFYCQVCTRPLEAAPNAASKAASKTGSTASKKVVVCPSCSTQMYCSKECMALDRSDHKASCKAHSTPTLHACGTIRSIELKTNEASPDADQLQNRLLICVQWGADIRGMTEFRVHGPFVMQQGDESVRTIDAHHSLLAFARPRLDLAVITEEEATSPTNRKQGTFVFGEGGVRHRYKEWVQYLMAMQAGNIMQLNSSMLTADSAQAAAIGAAAGAGAGSKQSALVANGSTDASLSQEVQQEVLDALAMVSGTYGLISSGVKGGAKESRHGLQLGVHPQFKVDSNAATILQEGGGRPMYAKEVELDAGRMSWMLLRWDHSVAAWVVSLSRERVGGNMAVDALSTGKRDAGGASIALKNDGASKDDASKDGGAKGESLRVRLIGRGEAITPDRVQKWEVVTKATDSESSSPFERTTDLQVHALIRSSTDAPIRSSTH